MALRFYLKWAVQNLSNHRMRTFLTIVGVAVAVAILVGIMGFYEGYRQSLRESVENMGFHVLVTAKGCPYEAATLILRGGQIPMYIDEQICRKVESRDDVASVAKLFLQTLPDKKRDRVHFFMGVEKSFLTMKPWLRFQRGGWFRSPDADEVILGYNVASYLKKDEGDDLLFPGLRRPFRVIGVLERNGSQDDGTIFLPLGVAQKLFDRKGKLTGLGIRVKDLDKLDRFVEEIYDLPAVQVIATSQIQGTLMRLVDTMRIVMLSIGLCASLIAAVALVNTVLMSIYERTREFGVLRAIGGGARHLLLIVTLETSLLTLVGAVAGNVLILALRGSAEWLVRAILPFAPHGHILRVEFTHQAGAVLVAAAAGVLCGLWPAFRAAQIRPVQSLRYGE
jgi:putative ABC transport system permease protein